MIWRTGMSGQTRAGLDFRVVADDALGMDGPLVVLVKNGTAESVVRLPRNGVGVDRPAFDLLPPMLKVPS